MALAAGVRSFPRRLGVRKALVWKPPGIGEVTSSLARPFCALGRNTPVASPTRPGYLPVINAARDGVQSAEVTEKSVKRVPSAAIRSRCGVRMSRAPLQPRSP